MTPIFIISFNRYTVLKKLIDRLYAMNQERIIILDNQSSYEPLLDFYRDLGKSVEIIYFQKNFGHNVLCMIYRDI